MCYHYFLIFCWLSILKLLFWLELLLFLTRIFFRLITKTIVIIIIISSPEAIIPPDNPIVRWSLDFPIRELSYCCEIKVVVFSEYEIVLNGIDENAPVIVPIMLISNLIVVVVKLIFSSTLVRVISVVSWLMIILDKLEIIDEVWADNGATEVVIVDFFDSEFVSIVYIVGVMVSKVVVLVVIIAGVVFEKSSFILFVVVLAVSIVLCVDNLSSDVIVISVNEGVSTGFVDLVAKFCEIVRVRWKVELIVDKAIIIRNKNILK